MLLRTLVTAPRAAALTVAGLPHASAAFVRFVPRLMEELPVLASDLHVLLRDLERMTARDGELTVLLRETGRLLAAEADARRVPRRLDDPAGERGGAAPGPQGGWTVDGSSSPPPG